MQSGDAMPLHGELTRRGDRNRRHAWLHRVAAALAGAILGLTALFAWPRVLDAAFWARPHTPDEIVRHIMQNHAIPGAVVAVGAASEIPRVSAFGHTLDGRAMRPDEPFSLASLSKPITAAAIMRLVEKGTISLDDSLVDVMPLALSATDPRYRMITLRHLLQHSGGWTRPANFGLVGDDCTPVAQEALAQPLDFTPGTRNVYSNVGYCWLELIIARRSGTSYEAFVRDEVLAPAGAARLKLKYPLLGGFGGWSGTAADYLRFASLAASPKQTESTVRLEDPPLDYGLGVVAIGRGAGHWGWLTGRQRVFTLSLRRPDGTAVVALFNGHPEDARGTAVKALRALVGATGIEPVTPTMSR